LLDDLLFRKSMVRNEDFWQEKSGHLLKVLTEHKLFKKELKNVEFSANLTQEPYQRPQIVSMVDDLKASLESLLDEHGEITVKAALWGIFEERAAKAPSKSMHATDKKAEEHFDNRRRLSAFLGDTPAAAASLINSMPTGFLHSKSFAQLLSYEEISKLVTSYLNAIKMSNGIEEAISFWFEKMFPSGDNFELDDIMVNMLDNLKLFLTRLANLIRPLMKMSRIGVAVRIFVALSIGYFDLTTDLLVANQYYEKGLTGWFYGSVTFVILTLIFHVIFAFMQYHRVSFQSAFKQSLIALTGLAPVVEGFQVWVGSEKDDGLMFDATVMLALIKATEVGLESLPESIIQCIAMQEMPYEDITNVLAFSISTSFLAIAFIITDANLSVARSYSLVCPGDEYHNWIPDKLSAVVKCLFGMFVFILFYSMCFVLAMSALYNQRQSFIPIGILLYAEFSIIMVYKILKGEFFEFAFMSAYAPKTDVFFGIFCHIMYYITTCAAPLVVIGHPWAMGPVLWHGLILWRFISNTIIILFCVNQVGDTTWITKEALLIAYFSSLLLSLAGGLFHIYYKQKRVPRNPCRNECAKGFSHNVVFNKDFAPYNTFESKEKYPYECRCVGMWLFLHPMCFYSHTIEEFICEHLKPFQGLSNEELKSQEPAFLTEKFHRMSRQKIKAYGGSTEKNILDALKYLPVFVEEEDKRSTRQKSKKIKAEKIMPIQ